MTATPVVHSDGSQTTSGTTEHDLATITTAGIYVLVVDLDDMVGGSTPDELEISMYGKTRSGGTERHIVTYPFSGDQAKEVQFESRAFVVTHHIRFTVKAVQGTITLPWEIRQV